MKKILLLTLCFILIASIGYAQPWGMIAFTWPHGSFKQYLGGNQTTETIWNEISPFSDAFVQESVYEYGQSSGSYPMPDTVFLYSRSYLGVGYEMNRGTYAQAIKPEIWFDTQREGEMVKNRFQSDRVTCVGGKWIDDHYRNSAVEFVNDNSKSSVVGQYCSSWIPTMAYAFYRIAEEKQDLGWTIFDVRAALRMSSTNYPNFGYGNSTYGGTRVEGFGMPDLATALSYDLADISLFAPFINSIYVLGDNIKVVGVDWISTLLKNSTIVLFSTMPGENATPEDGLILFSGKFSDNVSGVYIDLNSIPIEYQNGTRYLAVFSQYHDNSFTHMNTYKHSDGTVFNMDAYEIVFGEWDYEYDFDNDGDVDGSDLAEFAFTFNGDLGSFAIAFGGP